MTVDREEEAIPGLGQLTLANVNCVRKKTKYLNISEKQDLGVTVECKNIFKKSRVKI